MRVAVVLPRGLSFSQTTPTSIDSVVRYFADASTNRDNITILTSPVKDPPPDLNVVSVPEGSNRRHYAQKVVSLLKDIKPDLIEIHQQISTASYCARAFPKIPVILYRHNFMKEPQNRLSLWYRRYHHRHIAHFIFVSQKAVRHFRRHLPYAAERVSPILNAIPAEPWCGDVKNKEKLIVFSGRTEPRKGFAEACQGVAFALKKRPDWRAVFLCTEWDMHQEFAENATACLEPVKDQVLILKNQPITAVQSWLKKSAVALVPSFNEPFGLVALEAHHAGAALVSSGTGGLREVSGACALYLQQITADQIDHALSFFMTHEKTRLDYAQKGQDRARTIFDIHDFSRKLDRLREEIVHRFHHQI